MPGLGIGLDTCLKFGPKMAGGKDQPWISGGSQEYLTTDLDNPKAQATI